LAQRIDKNQKSLTEPGDFSVIGHFGESFAKLICHLKRRIPIDREHSPLCLQLSSENLCQDVLILADVLSWSVMNFAPALRSRLRPGWLSPPEYQHAVGVESHIQQEGGDSGLPPPAEGLSKFSPKRRVRRLSNLPAACSLAA